MLRPGLHCDARKPGLALTTVCVCTRIKLGSSSTERWTRLTRLCMLATRLAVRVALRAGNSVKSELCGDENLC